MLAITGHWTSNDYRAEATLIAIRELEEEHTGENISQVVYDVVQEYRIEDKLGYFMMDNATNNDTALRYLDRRLHEEGMVGFDVEQHRLRCWGHIMNVVVKDLFVGPKGSAVLERKYQRQDNKDVETYYKE